MATEAPPLRTPRAAPLAPGRQRGLLIALLALAVGVFVLAPLTVFTIRRSAMAERANPAVIIGLSAGAMRFEPAEIHVPRGAVIRVDFSDDDPTSPHDFQTF